MTIDAAIRQHLASSPAITALVPPASISCAGELPEGEAFPSITILTSAYPDTDLAGQAVTERTVAELEISTVDSEAGNALAVAKRIAEALRAALHCYRGPMGGHVIQGAFLQQTNDLEADEGINGMTLEFEVWHRPA
jgi:hypothetical protein